MIANGASDIAMLRVALHCPRMSRAQQMKTNNATGPQTASAASVALTWVLSVMRSIATSIPAEYAAAVPKMN